MPANIPHLEPSDSPAQWTRAQTLKSNSRNSRAPAFASSIAASRVALGMRSSALSLGDSSRACHSLNFCCHSAIPTISFRDQQSPD
jgi:hypothetical protein